MLEVVEYTKIVSQYKPSSWNISVQIIKCIKMYSSINQFYTIPIDLVSFRVYRSEESLQSLTSMQGF